MYFSYNDKTKTAIIPLKVKAGARETAIHGFVDISGIYTLKISINTAPENGKANDSIVKMLAKKFGLKQNQLAIIKGESSSSKLLSVSDIEKEEMEMVLVNCHGK